jgi:hypothetical protein
MKRLSNWNAQLEEVLLAGRSRSFAWGSFDCALFACDCVLVQTGQDPAADFRGKYTSAAEASAWGSLGEIASRITTQFSMPEISPGHAGRGDLVLVDNGTEQGAIGVVDFDASCALCPGTRGLIRVRRHRWKRAWKV